MTPGTTAASVKNFWPAVVDEIAANILDSQLVVYISRATMLLNSVGDLSLTSQDLIDSFEMGTNMLVRRLILADAHPASASDAAGVLQETAKGLSWNFGRTRVTRTFSDIIGFDILAIIAECFTPGSVIGKLDTQVFPTRTGLSYPNSDGENTGLFDPRLDDNLTRTVSERLGIHLDPWQGGGSGYLPGSRGKP